MESNQTPNETPQVSSTESAQAELDRIMSQYTTAAKTFDTGIENIQKPAESVASNLAISQPTIQAPKAPISTDPDAPYGRYKSGTKAGMPKPKPKNYVPPPAPVQQAPQEVKLSGVIIEGAMMLTLVNLIVPAVISIVNNMVSDRKIKPDIIQLKPNQKKELDPIADACMKNASMTGNPFVMLFIGIVSAMGLNYLQWKIEEDMKDAKLRMQKPK